MAAAQARIQIAAAEFQKARVLWLPSANGGVPISRMRAGRNPIGYLVNANKDFLYAGGSLRLELATTDAIFEPLAARQVLAPATAACRPLERSPVGHGRRLLHVQQGAARTPR